MKRERAQVKEEQNENFKPARKVLNVTDKRLNQMVKCKTGDGEIIEAPWHLMMQSRTFSDSVTKWDEKIADAEPFVFSETISGHCFHAVLDWMREHDGKPEKVLQLDSVTGERMWFKFTYWEKEFFAGMKLEGVKECFSAANYFNMRSLYLLCGQELARSIIDKEEEQVRHMLLLPNDFTEEEERANWAQFNMHNGNNNADTEMIEWHLYLDGLKQQMIKMARKKGSSSANHQQPLDCATLADPTLPVKSLLFLNPKAVQGNVKRFFYACLAHGTDQCGCCARAGVSAECVPICNAAAPPADEGIELLLDQCYEHKSAISHCFCWRMSSQDNGQLHLVEANNKK